LQYFSTNPKYFINKMNQTNLYQPIFVQTPEYKHDVFTLQKFVEFLREEEAYYQDEPHSLPLMITRLRKIFYDQWGWNSELIRGAADIPMRYEVRVVAEPSLNSRPVDHFPNQAGAQAKHRVVVYTDHDKIYGASRAGQTPILYQDDHQEILLPEGNYCDIAHVLAGLDAYIHPQIVTPLPPFLSFLTPLFPHVTHNIDVVTWLGEIASSAGDFLFAYFAQGKQPLSEAQEQTIINSRAGGSDMLGDIDAFVIAKSYDMTEQSKWQVSTILLDYYSPANQFRANRISIFCEAVGLKGWNGSSFNNENKWIKYYTKQLRDNTTFQVFSLTTEKITDIILPIRIWCGGYSDILKLELLLTLFLDELKKALIKGL
jgi:hypothetical protein